MVERLLTQGVLVVSTDDLDTSPNPHLVQALEGVRIAGWQFHRLLNKDLLGLELDLNGPAFIQDDQLREEREQNLVLTSQGTIEVSDITLYPDTVKPRTEYKAKNHSFEAILGLEGRAVLAFAGLHEEVQIDPGTLVYIPPLVFRGWSGLQTDKFKYRSVSFYSPTA